MFGFLNIDKDAEMTSHTVVDTIRKRVGRGVKVGHAGTLDPAATGVLPIALGPATRLIAYLSGARKGYRACISLGATTTTDDAEGDILEQHPVPLFENGVLDAVLNDFRGTIMQVPPMYSARHHKGQRLYDLARAGQVVERTPTPVTIDALTLVAYDSQTNQFDIDVVCSTGTYIRSLARDIGAALGCGAHLATLRRTFVGPFTVEQSVSLTNLPDDPAALAQVLLPPDSAVADWPVVVLSPDQCMRVRHGMPVYLDDEAFDGYTHVRAHMPDGGGLLALLQHQGNVWHPDKVFHVSQLDICRV